MDDFAHYARRGRFAFSQPPIEGESLVGFVARNADIHGVEKVSTALKPAGVYTARVGFLPLSAAGNVEGLAYAFGAPEKEILARSYPAVDPDGRPGNAFVDFFGAPVRSVYVETRVRRVSPRALRANAFHRAVWDLRPFVFCPETGERLLDACPSCGAGLAWTWTCGPALCEHCRADLREHPQPLVDRFDDPHVRLVTSMVDPLVDRRRHPVRLGDCFGAAARSDLFEFCMALARTVGLCRSPALAECASAPRRDAFKAPPIEDLAFAGRVIANWRKDGLAPLVEIAAAATKARGAVWGVSEEFRRLRALPRDAYLHPSIRAACETSLANELRQTPAPLRYREFRDEMWITAREAARFRISREMVRLWRKDGLLKATTNPDDRASVVVMDRAEIAGIAAERDGALDRAAVAERLGVDAVAVIRIAALGLIETVGRPAADMLVGDCYRGASVDGFVERLERIAAAPEGAIISLGGAVAGAGVTPDRIWPGVFAAVLSGRLPLFTLALPGGSVAERFAVPRGVDIVGFLVEPDAGAYAGIRFSLKEARAYLNASLNVITLLHQERLLRQNGSSRTKLDFADVDAFRQRHVLTGEVAARMGVHPAVAVKLLRARGVTPAWTLSDGTLLWGRDAIGRAMGRM